MNLILILLLVAIGVGGIAYFLRKEQMMEVPEIYEDKFSLQYLVGQVNETINQVMKTNTASYFALNSSTLPMTTDFSSVSKLMPSFSTRS